MIMQPVLLSWRVLLSSLLQPVIPGHILECGLQQTRGKLSEIDPKHLLMKSRFEAAQNHTHTTHTQRTQQTHTHTWRCTMSHAQKDFSFICGGERVGCVQHVTILCIHLCFILFLVLDLICVCLRPRLAVVARKSSEPS